jgi:hypothetical protein
MVETNQLPEIANNIISNETGTTIAEMSATSIATDGIEPQIQDGIFFYCGLFP